MSIVATHLLKNSVVLSSVEREEFPFEAEENLDRFHIIVPCLT